MKESKIVAIHQPNFLPWLGYFHKIMESDVFVLLDDVEYTKNGFINRNKIKTPQGEQWITVPVNYSGKSKQKINEVDIFNPEKFKKKILATIEMNYKKADYFNNYFEELAEVFYNSNQKLSKLNILLIKWICEKLDIESLIYTSSELDIIEDDPSAKLIAICKEFNGNQYLSGFGGDNYQEHQKFEEAGIELIQSKFKQTEYSQKWGEFIPYLSVIDGLLNLGDKLKEVISK